MIFLKNSGTSDSKSYLPSLEYTECFACRKSKTPLKEKCFLDMTLNYI